MPQKRSAEKSAIMQEAKRERVRRANISEAQREVDK